MVICIEIGHAAYILFWAKGIVVSILYFRPLSRECVIYILAPKFVPEFHLELWVIGF